MTEQELVEGHGLTDVSCEHGSRWVWDRFRICWPMGPLGDWGRVVTAPNCECPDPPRPFKEAAEK